MKGSKEWGSVSGFSLDNTPIRHDQSGEAPVRRLVETIVILDEKIRGEFESGIEVDV